MRYLLLAIVSICFLNCYSQNTAIDLNRISQKKVKCLLESHFTKSNQLENYFVQPTYHKGQGLRGYHRLESAYLIKAMPDVVWESYQTISPAESWNGKMVSFGVLIAKCQQQIFYPDDRNFSGIDTGQVFYVNLRLMRGIYNLAVGLEIIDIDARHKTITYSYINGGKSRGEQTIQFIPTRKGYTEIIHRTAFKGSSFIRDYYLYPYFHRLAINEFHRNMKKSIQANREKNTSNEMSQLSIN